MTKPFAILFALFLTFITCLSQAQTKEYPFALGCRQLKKGIKGKDVSKLKILLKGKGYLEFPCDYRIKEKERFDKKTFNAIKRFQTDHELPITGKVDPITIYHLKFLP